MSRKRLNESCLSFNLLKWDLKFRSGKIFENPLYKFLYGRFSFFIYAGVRDICVMDKLLGKHSEDLFNKRKQ